MSIVLEGNRNKIRNLVNKIKDSAQKLPEIEKEIILSRLSRANSEDTKLNYIIDLINTVNSWYWNQKYGRIEKSYLYNIYTCLEQLKPMLE